MKESIYLEDDCPLVVLTDREGGAGAGELEDEDEEEDDHVDEEHDLVLPNRTDDPQHGDEKQEYPAGGDASYDGQTGDDAGELAWERDNGVMKKYIDMSTYCERRLQ